MENKMTDLTFNQILGEEIQEWNKFRRAWKREDQQFLDQMEDQQPAIYKQGEVWWQEMFNFQMPMPSKLGPLASS